MNTRIYRYASTKDQGDERALADLNALAKAVGCGVATVYRLAKSFYLPDQMKFIRHSVCMNMHLLR